MAVEVWTALRQEDQDDVGQLIAGVQAFHPGSRYRRSTSPGYEWLGFLKRSAGSYLNLTLPESLFVVESSQRQEGPHRSGR